MQKDTMTTRERFHAVMNLKPFDRLPILEWAPWWDKTIGPWFEEGLPKSLMPGEAGSQMPGDAQSQNRINRYFGMDIYELNYPQGLSAAPKGLEKEVGEIANVDDYRRVRRHLYPWPVVDRDWWRSQIKPQKDGEIVIFCEPMGYFFFARDLLGIEEHLYALADQPDLIHAINADLLEYHLKIFDEVCSICIPDFISFAEDMSYNHGPMLSKAMFDEYMKPYYEKLLPRLKERGILILVDSDGDITCPMGWFQSAGVEGMLPLERQAGVDAIQMRQRYPGMRFIGCFDKMTMFKGENAMRAEFERLLPLAKQGGVILGCDHQTPPGVSFKDYQVYLRLFREYALKAAH
ncbi:MAG: hypothetical protein HY360_18560 [Verrucomicrobia bacterium]|nr:hypothetical protein [Verrucomicrobiota bacterium]